MQILSHLTQPATLAPSFILNTISIALAYFIIHTHQSWTTVIEDMTAYLSTNIDQVSCMMQVLKFMANDCDNDSIVIEDSIRKTFYKYMDGLSRVKVFKQILDFWALKIA